MSTTRTILVLSSTGNQGGALVRALAKVNDAADEGAKPFKILAHTRDASAAPAKAIEGLKGVELIEGTYETLAEAFESHKPIHGVFNSPPSMFPGEYEKSTQVMDLAATHGVEHMVFSTVDFGGQDDTEIPFRFEVKRKLEDYIKTKPFKWTILRPVSFMSNIAAYDTDDVKAIITYLQCLMFPSLKNDALKLHWIAPTDIGAFAAIAFQQPEAYASKTLEIAGDELNGAEFAQAFEDAGISLEISTPELMAKAIILGQKHPLYNKIHKWVTAPSPDARADIPTLRTIHPGLKTLKMFLETEVKPTKEI